VARKLTQEQKTLAFRLRKQGLSKAEIARQICCTDGLVVYMFQGKAPSTGTPSEWSPRRGALTIDDREQILLGLRATDSLSSIARRLGRSPSTIMREVNANGGRRHYRAWHAHERAREQARRPKKCKLARGPLQREVTPRLEQFWSPQEIAHRLPLDDPHDPAMRVSHETIYQSLFVQGRGEVRRELTRCLRSGKTARKRPLAHDGRGHIPGMVNISERPAEVADRAVPGHWEGDLFVGPVDEVPWARWSSAPVGSPCCSI
jgi:transposase, IS30 family